MLSYSCFLKEIIFLDVILISSGFVIRVIAGAIAIEVPISIWICLCMMSGALFIAVSKRFSEIKTNKDNFVFQRPVLINYSILSKKKSILAFIMIVTIILYSLYTIFATNLPDNNLMLITIPFVIVGMTRYFYLVIKSDLGERPESIVVKDFVMRMAIASWLLLVGVVLYFWR
jgi:4-hydroxybenzoate polyprenyltransferase